MNNIKLRINTLPQNLFSMLIIIKIPYCALLNTRLCNNLIESEINITKNHTFKGNKPIIILR